MNFSIKQVKYVDQMVRISSWMERGRLTFVFAITAIVLMAAKSVQAQSYGPSNIVAAPAGYLYVSTGNFTDTNSSNDYGDVDFYSAELPGFIVSHIFIDASLNIYTYDAGTSSNASYQGTYNGTTGTSTNGWKTLSVIESGPRIVFQTNNPITSINGTSAQNTDYCIYYSGVWRSIIQNPPIGTVFSAADSPSYMYTGGVATVDAYTTGSWPATNLCAAPPQDVYVNTSHFVLDGIDVTCWAGSYTENLTYKTATGTYGVTIHRTATGDIGGQISFQGDIAGNVNGGSFTGLFNPNTWQVTNLAGSASVVHFSAPVGVPLRGPAYISFDGTLLKFAYTDTNGADVYSSASSEKWVSILANGGVEGLGIGSVSYDTTTSNFFVAPGELSLNLLALDVNGNPSGLPAGVTVISGASIAGNFLFSGGQVSPTYSYRRPDGSWVYRADDIPVGNWFLISGSQGTFNSQIYFFSGDDIVINAINGWPVSNGYPGQIYVDGVLCSMKWDTHYEGVAGPPNYGTYGGVSYALAGEAAAVTLGWTWNVHANPSEGPIWSWSRGGYSGAWDGGSTFSDLPAGMLLSFEAPPTAPSFGPPRIVWNGSELGFNGVASQASGADVFSGAGIQLQINTDGSVVVTDVNTGEVLFTGTYSPTTHHFDFGSAAFGTVSAMDGQGHLLATSVTGGGVYAGNLDIRGNVLTLGSWTDADGGSISGFYLTFTPPNGTQTGGLLRFGSTLAVTDWLWSRAVTDAAPEAVNMMKLDSANRLTLFNPANAAAAIVIDPDAADPKITINGQRVLTTGGGANSFYIGADGKVGIGTQTPGGTLDVIGNVGIGVPGVSLGETVRSVRVGGLDNAVISLVGQNDWQMSSYSNGSFAYYNATDNITPFKMLASGRVGINVGAEGIPATYLQVNDFSDQIAVPITVANNNSGIGVGVAQNYSAHADPGSFAAFAQTGMVTTVADGGTYSGDFYVATAENGVLEEKVRVTASGNVGIGTTTPAARLEVLGNAHVRGVLRVPQAGDVDMGDFKNGTNPIPQP